MNLQRSPDSRLFLTPVAVAMIAALGGCATPSGGGSAGEPSGGVSGGISLPGGGMGLPGGDSSGAGLPGAGLPGTGLPGAGLPDSGVSTGGAKKGDGADGDAAGTAEGEAPAVPEPATTADERRAVLDRRLDETLGTFDAELKREQDRVAQERDSRAATGAGSADGSGGGGGAGDGTGRSGDLQSDKAARDAAVAAAGSSGGASSGNTSSGAGSGAANKGIPSGDDDDIVAKRLRRAAEQETDPELKEKLWKEYTDYKRNAGKG